MKPRNMQSFSSHQPPPLLPPVHSPGRREHQWGKANDEIKMPPSLPFQGVPRDYTRAKFLFPQPLLSGLIAVLVFSILERLLFADIRAQSLVKSFNLLFNPLFVERRQQNKNFCPPRIRGSFARIKEPLPLRRSKYICFGCNLF